MPKRLTAIAVSVVALASTTLAEEPDGRAKALLFLLDRSEAGKNPINPRGATGSSSTEKPDLLAADRLQIKIQGYTELSGEYRVGTDGTISVPVLGRISVDNMSVAELETTLGRRVTALTSREAYVAVEIAEYRPIFVTGYVAKPGSMPWRPGLNVLQATALAGGMFRGATDNGGSVAASGLVSDGEVVRLQKAIVEQKQNLAALARLEAERNGETVIAVPPRLIALVGKGEAQTLIDAQVSALQSRQSAVEAKDAALTRAKDMTLRELAELKQRAARLKKELTSRRDYMGKVNDLQSKGIVRLERSFEEFSRVSSLEDRTSDNEISMARALGMLAGLEREAVNLHQERLADIDAAIIKLHREIGRLDIELEAARASYRKMTGREPPSALDLSASANATKSALKYELVRQQGGRSTTSPCDPSTSLRPGDVIVVSMD